MEWVCLIGSYPTTSAIMFHPSYDRQLRMHPFHIFGGMYYVGHFKCEHNGFLIRFLASLITLDRASSKWKKSDNKAESPPKSNPSLIPQPELKVGRLISTKPPLPFQSLVVYNMWSHSCCLIASLLIVEISGSFLKNPLRFFLRLLNENLRRGEAKYIVSLCEIIF